MEVAYNENEGVLVVQFCGRLDTTTSPDAENELMARIDEGKTLIIIDFNETAYIASSGLRVLLKTAKMLEKRAGRFALCRANQQVLDVLEMSGFLMIMQHFLSLDEAVSFSRGA